MHTRTRRDVRVTRENEESVRKRRKRERESSASPLLISLSLLVAVVCATLLLCANAQGPRASATPSRLPGSSTRRVRSLATGS